jgi:hypothetical protein
MLTKMKDHIVVCMYNKAPLSDLDARRLKERIIASKPHYWEEYEPGIYVAFFLIKRGGRTKSIKLTASVRVMKGPGTPFEDIGVDKAVGELLTETNWFGKILTCPFGDAVNQAIKKAREDADKDFSPKEKKTEEAGE